MSIGTLDLKRLPHRYPVTPGARRKFRARTNIVFPANQTILGYAATYQETIANVDDTTIMAAINSAWYVNSVSVY